jgi:galactoside O-acetyltransferase
VIGDNFSMNTNSQLGAASGKIVIGNDCWRDYSRR